MQHGVGLMMKVRMIMMRMMRLTMLLVMMRMMIDWQRH